MNDALYIAATGMQAQQLNVDTIANNMANVATPGYKRGRVNFRDLMYRDVSSTAINDDKASGEPGAMPMQTGSGVGVATLLKYFGPGELKNTGNPLDLAVRGDGFLEVQLADGSSAYWRGGTARVNADGYLTTAEGDVLKPQIHIGQDVAQWTVGEDGRVVATGKSGRPYELGQLELQHFTNAAGLQSIGANLYRATEDSGESIPARAMTEGESGAIAQGQLEQSNVQLVDEMVNLMLAQRAYEMNVKVIQAADEMIGMSNNLRK